MAQAAVALGDGVKATIRKVEIDRPWKWLEKGWDDLRRNPTVGFSYGLLAAVTGYLVTYGLWWSGYYYLVLPCVAGFLIVGPILTVGLYEVSRRQEAGLQTTLAQALAAFQRNPTQIALMGLALLLLMMAWARFATILFFLYFGMTPPSFEDLFAQTFLQADTIPFLVLGVGTGAVLAFIAFSISAISIPLLLDRPEANVVEAMARSFEAVQANLAAMLLWAGLIVVFMLAGLITFYIGLIVTLPLVGHASWHAYRDLVRWSDRP